jgi:hypothetical protein
MGMKRGAAPKATLPRMSGMGGGKSQTFDEGGGIEDDTNELTPIVTAGGEMLVDPEIVMALGQGSIDEGKKALINSVMTVRKEVAKLSKKLPRPVP